MSKRQGSMTVRKSLVENLKAEDVAVVPAKFCSTGADDVLVVQELKVDTDKGMCEVYGLRFGELVIEYIPVGTELPLWPSF
ncbi:hypothetical protein [Gordonia sp. (in: high G+C Gram-positive bacteria)]|uniref:hypothetical protein n=1 Tax=Gordonia sp. (in: high G+C Gram-positive bacteria) TaxID=84139 RepID=UPI003F99AA7C